MNPAANADEAVSARPEEGFAPRLGGFIRAAAPAMIGFVSGTAFMAFVLAELGRFNHYLAFAAGVAAALIYYRASRRIFYDGNTGNDFIACALFAIVIAFSSLFATLPASEMILGGWDPGVYIHTASKLAGEGSIQIDEQDFARMEAGELQSVSADLHGVSEPFKGMRLLPSGKLSPQFFHLYPALMAIAESFFGIAACLGLNAFLNIGCILALYAFAGRLFGWRWGLLAAFLLAINPGQIWQAKFQTAELLVQLLLLGGSNFLLGLDRPAERTTAAAMAGLSFGLALLTRYDTILFIVPLLLIILWQAASRTRHRAALLTAAIILTGALHAWIHIYYLAPHYHPVPGLVLPGLIIAAIAAAIILAAGFALSRGAIERAHSFAARIRPAMALLFAAFAVWAWYLRPRLSLDGRVAHAVDSLLSSLGISALPAWVANMNAWNMHRLASILGGFGLLLALIGVVLMIWRMKGVWRRTWLSCSALVTALLITKPFHDQFMMWMTRRYISVAMPLLVIGIVYSLKTIRDSLAAHSTIAARSICAIALGAIVFQAAPESLSMARLRNWPGLLQWYADIDSQIPPRSTIYCDQPGFAAPFRFLFDHHSYQLDIEQPRGFRHINSLIRKSIIENGEAYFLTLAGPPTVPGVRVSETRRPYLKSSTIQRPYVGVPRASRGRGGRFNLYRLELENGK